MSTTQLFAALFFSCIGMGHLAYGKTQRRAVALFSGLTLCVYPYSVTDVVLICAVGVGLAALPFWIRY